MTRIIRTLPFRLVTLLLAVGLLATACGGSKGGGGSAGAAGTEGKGAAATPQGVLFFGDANIDPGSDAWAKLQALGAKFPGWSKVVTQFETSLNSTSTSGANFHQDIRPWLGTEASVAVVSLTPGAPGAEPKPVIVAYVESKDDAKLEAAIQKGGKVQKTGDYKGYALFKSTEDDQMFAAIGKGALLVATDDANLRRAIDTREGDNPALADSQTYKDALAKLPSSNLAVGYVDGSSVSQLVQLAMSQQSMSGVTGPAADQIQKLQD